MYQYIKPEVFKENSVGPILNRLFVKNISNDIIVI